MHYMINYLLFFAKTISLLILLLAFFALFLGLVAKSKQKKTNCLRLKSLNKEFETLQNKITIAGAEKDELKKIRKEKKLNKKNDKKKNKSRLFVIKFKGDIQARATEALTQQINAIILGYQENDAVFLRLESPGGVVPGYGLAAAQLARLRQYNIPLTIAIDKVAASGGYLMASVANNIIAAPLAIIGSIGVVAQLPNFNRFLDKNHIDFEQITAGQYKRTLTFFGENTNEGRDKMQSEVNETLDLFKKHISCYRPQVDIERVATGEHWYAQQAIDLQLIDQLMSSDDYLLDAYKSKEIFEIVYPLKSSKFEKIINGGLNLLQKITNPNGCDFINIH